MAVLAAAIRKAADKKEAEFQTGLAKQVINRLLPLLEITVNSLLNSP